MASFVGPYRILRLVNRGGQGSVYLGYDRRLHRRVAIKVCDLPRKRAERRRLLDEARAVAGIQSPRVVQVHDVIESGKHLALVMEYIPGCSLEEFLSKARPSLASILRVGIDIAGALAIARQEHIVHGDVKAANILVTNTGRAKLADFGISSAARSAVSSQGRGASPTALSPEQARGEPLDERADLFALGCLLYRMLSGEHPFVRLGRLDTDILLKQPARPLTEVVRGDTELPPPLVTLIGDLLEKDPRRRTPNTRHVRHVLRLLARDLPLSSRDSLLREALPFFRHEPPEDLPPPIPDDLARRGRSALLPDDSRGARLWHWLSGLWWPGRAALGLAVIALVATPLVIAQKSKLVTVRFDEPDTSFARQLSLPREISDAWLLQQVKQALAEQLGEYTVVGRVGAPPETALYPRGRPAHWWQQPEQSFYLALRCMDELCVFVINREQAGERIHRQGVVLPEMSIDQWQDVVRGTTLALYR